MTLWMAIDTRSKYKLPLYVCDTPQEMAEKFHTTTMNVWSCDSHYKKCGKERRFIRIEVDDED